MKKTLAMTFGVAITLGTTCASAQDALLARAQNIQAWYRDSLMIDGTKVLVMSNPSLSAVKLQLACFAADGTGKRWHVVIPAKDTTEIGVLEGWSGGFVPGEWCEAYYYDTALWTIAVR